MELPIEFTGRMQHLLQEEYPAFLASYEQERAQALRVNTQKISPEEFIEKKIFSLEPVPWVKEGFYYPKEERPGKHPYHEMGVYYIQEPSAMVTASLAGVQPGERVLDLCAAPGGKSTQLAAAMQGKGLLVANEIHPARAKILSQNIERMGITHAVVTNETPAHLAEVFPCFFDRIVVDAPCSGEGMFKKEEQASIQWSPENVALCAKRQREILDAAVAMLRPGGTLVYSTCTFAPEENEQSIAYVLQRYPDFHVKKVKTYEGFSKGNPEWADGNKALSDTIRLWPHRLRGEGHFAAVLSRDGASISTAFRGKLPPVDKNAWKSWQEFSKESLQVLPKGEPLQFGDQLYLLPEGIPVKGLKILRAGLHLGTVKKNRFEPSHALAFALQKEQVTQSMDLVLGDERIEQYLRGGTISGEGEKGWNLLCVDGMPIGWGKYSNGILKNHYPKGLRWV